MENDNFKEQLLIYENEFKQSIENYANSHWFDVEYDITKHPKYKQLSDYDKKNEFDIEKFVSTKLRTKPDDVYEVYEIDVSDEQQQSP